MRMIRPLMTVCTSVFVCLSVFTGIPAAAQGAVPVKPRIAYVWLFGDGPSAPYAESFRQRLGELGWVDGRNATIEQRDAKGSVAALDAIMKELVDSKVDVIVAMCTPEALSARKFTTTIPIVMAATGDPVKPGLAQSLARPGGNVTGISGMQLEMSARRVALLKEAFPQLTQATVLWNPARPDNRPEVKSMQDAATSLGMKVKSSEVHSHDDMTQLLMGMPADGTQAILETGDSLMASERNAIVARAALLKLPALYEDRVFVEAGGLMSYGPDVRSMHRHAADYVDRILKGAKPSELPIEQPTSFKFIVNQKTARALGVVIPQITLLQADEVIE